VPPRRRLAPKGRGLYVLGMWQVPAVDRESHGVECDVHHGDGADARCHIPAEVRAVEFRNPTTHPPSLVHRADLSRLARRSIYMLIEVANVFGIWLVLALAIAICSCRYCGNLGGGGGGGGSDSTATSRVKLMAPAQFEKEAPRGRIAL
jgi:hypothetical protein